MIFDVSIENKDKIGIYRIVNIKNNKIYIGSTTASIYSRYRRHKWELENNNHHNKYLQNDYNKCGKESFVFEIIEITNDKNKVLLLEQKVIDLYYDNQKQCYNLLKLTNKNTKSLFSKTPEETKKKISNKIKEAWLDEEKRKKFLENRTSTWKKDDLTRRTKAAEVLAKNRSKSMETIKRKLSEYNKTDEAKHIREKTIDESIAIPYYLISSDNIEHKGKNLLKFCLKNNLNYKNMHALVSGTRKYSCGWRTIENKEYFPKKLKYINTVLVDPDNNKIIIDNSINDFCYQYPFLKKTNLISLINGKIKSYKGWRLEKNKEYVFLRAKSLHDSRAKIKRQSYCFKNVNGTVVCDVVNLLEFSKTHKISRASIGRLLKEPNKIIKGWTIINCITNRQENK